MNELTKFRDELPFADDVLRDIRSDVMRRIEREHRHESHWFGLFLRATFVAVALVLLVVRPVREVEVRVPPVPVRPRVAVVPAPPTPVIQTIASIQSSTHSSRRAPRRPRRIERTPPPAFAEPAPVRIELQTSNPNVRILWISQPSGETR